MSAGTPTASQSSVRRSRAPTSRLWTSASILSRWTSRCHCPPPFAPLVASIAPICPSPGHTRWPSHPLRATDDHLDAQVGQFVYVIRKRISIPPEKAIFIFVDNTLPPTAALMSTVYEQHKDEDGFMCAAPPSQPCASGRP